MNWSVVLGVRRRRVRRSARDRGPRRVRAGGHVPRAVDLRLGPALAARAPRHDLARRARHVAVGVLHPRRELVDAASRSATRSSTARRTSPTCGRCCPTRSRCARTCTSSWSALTTGSIVILGISCWHLLRGRNTDLFRRAAALALIVAVPVTLLNLIVGNRFGEAVTSAQRMKIAAAEALWDTEQPAGFSLFQIGGFSAEDPTPSFVDHGPEAPLLHGDRLVRRRGAGHQPAPGPAGAAVRPGQLHPGRRGDLLVDPGDGVPRGGDVPRGRGRRVALPQAAGSSGRAGTCARRSRRWPSRSSRRLSGWILTEMGRQPWIVQGLLKTADAHSPSVSTTMIAVSLGVFVAALRGARSRRLRPHAALRADRPARRRRVPAAVRARR